MPARRRIITAAAAANPIPSTARASHGRRRGGRGARSTGAGWAISRGDSRSVGWVIRSFTPRVRAMRAAAASPAGPA